MADTNLDKIVDTLSGLSLMDAAKLVTILKEKWNISDIQRVPVATSSGADSGAKDAAVAKTEFDVVLVSVGDNKLKVITKIKEILALTLSVAKELVESAPKVIKEGVSKEEAEKIKKLLEELGAKVEVK